MVKTGLYFEQKIFILHCDWELENFAKEKTLFRTEIQQILLSNSELVESEIHFREMGISNKLKSNVQRRACLSTIVVNEDRLIEI